MPSPKKEGDAEEEVMEIDMIDPDDPDYQKEGMRPSDIKEDVKMMDQRQRVQKILSSDAFRNELEDLIDVQIASGGPQTPSILALRQLSDLLGSKGGFRGGSAKSNGVLPINDIRGTEVGCYSKAERIMRCKLASCYRLLDINGWTHGIFNHISIRLDDESAGPVFLINPFGLLYSEVTASSLVKIDSQGNVIDQGSTTLGVNRPGWNLHAALHTARSDLRCLIHCHSPSVVAVSASKHGLLPGLSQEAMFLHPVTYHTYEGFVSEGERETLANDIGHVSKVMFLRNHGIVVGGATIEEAYNFLFNAMAAVDVQARLGSNIEPESVVQASEDTIESVASVTRKSVMHQTVNNDSGASQRWGVGELEYEALMRQLDNAGYRTGYPYRKVDLNAVSRGRPSDRDDIEIPPASTSSAFLYADDEERSKMLAAHRMMAERARAQHRTEWLSTPNTYHRQEVEETGTDKPRKFTRWVSDKNDENHHAGHGTPVKTPNQFAPQGSNPREFKQQQKKIRGKYFQDERSAGPQSRLLDGITEQEARKLVEEGRAKMSGNTVIVGAASMGIIQKEHRENAVVYHNVYTPNPFEKVTDEELSQYHDFVQSKGKPGEPVEIVPEAHEVVESPVQETENVPVQKEVAPAADTECDAYDPVGVDSVVKADPVLYETIEDDGSNYDEIVLQTPVLKTDPVPPPRKKERTKIETKPNSDTVPESDEELTLQAGPLAANVAPLEPVKEDVVMRTPEIKVAVPETKVEVVNTDTLRSETSAGHDDTTSQDESRASQISKDGDKKKKQKKGFRMPSFSKKKDKK